MLKLYIILPAFCILWPISRRAGSESRPRKVELASAHKKLDDYREYFTHNQDERVASRGQGK